MSWLSARAQMMERGDPIKLAPGATYEHFALLGQGLCSHPAPTVKSVGFTKIPIVNLSDSEVLVCGVALRILASLMGPLISNPEPGKAPKRFRSLVIDDSLEPGEGRLLVRGDDVTAIVPPDSHLGNLRSEIEKIAVVEAPFFVPYEDVLPLTSKTMWPPLLQIITDWLWQRVENKCAPYIERLDIKEVRKAITDRVHTDVPLTQVINELTEDWWENKSNEELMINRDLWQELVGELRRLVEAVTADDPEVIVPESDDFIFLSESHIWGDPLLATAHLQGFADIGTTLGGMMVFAQPNRNAVQLLLGRKGDVALRQLEHVRDITDVARALPRDRFVWSAAGTTPKLLPSEHAKEVSVLFTRDIELLVCGVSYAPQAMGLDGARDLLRLKAALRFNIAADEANVFWWQAMTSHAFGIRLHPTLYLQPEENFELKKAASVLGMDFLGFFLIWLAVAKSLAANAGEESARALVAYEHELKKVAHMLLFPALAADLDGLSQEDILLALLHETGGRARMIEVAFPLRACVFGQALLGDTSPLLLKQSKKVAFADKRDGSRS